MIHGGISGAENFERHKASNAGALRRIADAAYDYLQHHSALETVIEAVRMLEDDPLFNAGTGSVIQRDGIIRMSASVMDGNTKHFSGVINIQNVKNPVCIAATLLEKSDRILSGDEAQHYARDAGFEPYDPETHEARDAYEKRKAESRIGTVGCVALDAQGRLAAATSTGGKGFEIPGRVSDSATVAGNYADGHAAVSCTGVGEDIMSHILAPAVATRVADGLRLGEACEKTVAVLKESGGYAGLIALDKDGTMCVCASHPYVSWASHDGILRVFD